MKSSFKNIDREYVANTYGRFDLEITHGKGSLVYDINGKEYIDFFCGAGALNYGHNNPYIKEKVTAYIESDGIMHSLDMYTEAKRVFIEFFEEKVLKPRGLNYVIQFPGPTGTNVNDLTVLLINPQ